MNLPVLPGEEAYQLAAEAEQILKASPDDPKHPGYPKGAPDRRGGQFRSKTALVGEEAEKVVEKRLQNLVIRRTFRAGLRRILTARAALRAGAELVSNVDPFGPAEIGDALAIEQMGEIAAETAEIKVESEAALDFVKKGPWDLEDLYAGKKPENFDTFAAFKKISEVERNDVEKRYGDAKPGYEYHHIVEQGANGRTFSLRELNSTENIVEIPRLIHEEINSELATFKAGPEIRQSLRQSLTGKSFEQQRLEGIELMRRMGIIK